MTAELWQAGSQIGIDAATALSRGAREHQEDAVATACPQGAQRGFAILSDGMGGHAAGDLASRLIVSEMFATLTVRCGDPALAAARIPEILQQSVTRANDGLRAQTRTDPASDGMGGTAIAAMIADGHLYWISVGDSLLFLHRQGRLRRLNADHSMAPHIDRMAADGLIDAEAARTHPQRNCLTSALFGAEIESIDCPQTPHRLCPGDVVLLASDGLQTLSEAEIAATLATSARDDSNAIARALVSAVQDRNDPAQDNLSIVAIKVRPAPDGVEAIGRPVPWPRAAIARALAPMRQRAMRG